MDMDHFWHLRYGQGRNRRSGADKKTSGSSSQVGGTNYSGSIQSNIRTIHEGPTMDTLSPAFTRHLPCEVTGFQSVWPLGESRVCDDLRDYWLASPCAVFY